MPTTVEVIPTSRVPESHHPSPLESRPPSRGRNLRVKGPGKGFVFGNYNHGRVLPKWIAERCGRSAEKLVADGTMEWTDDLALPHPGDDWTAPKPEEGKPAIEAAVFEELDRLRRAEVQLTASNQIYAGENEELRSRVKLQQEELGKLTTEKAHWQQTSEGYRVQVEELTGAVADLEKLNGTLEAQGKDQHEQIEKLTKLADKKKPKES